MSLRFSFRLKPGRDNDLADWLSNLGEGERSFFIRNALRKAITESENIVVLSRKHEPESNSLSDKSTPDEKVNNQVVEESGIVEDKFDQFIKSF